MKKLFKWLLSPIKAVMPKAPAAIPLFQPDNFGLRGMVYPKDKTIQPPRRASTDDIRRAEEALVAGDNKGKHFVHYLGHFGGMQLQINEQDVPPEKIRHYPAKTHTCAHFTVDCDDTVYVFWNNPSEAQKKIHASLGEKNIARKGKSSHFDLTEEPDGGHYVGKIFSIVDSGSDQQIRLDSPLKEADVAPSRMKSDWKPEIGSTARPAPRRTTSAVQIGFPGPTYD